MTSIAEQQIRYNLSHPYRERKVIVGFTPRQKPVIDVITRAFPSLLISGYPGQGKSSLVAYITGEFVKAGATAFVVDPHADAPEDSLADRLRPLSPRYVTLTDFDLDRITDHLQFLWDEYLARHKKGGCDGKDTLLLVVDEWNEFLKILDDEQRELAIKVVSLVAKGGRKYGMFVCLIAHNANLAEIGGRNVGGSLQGRITLFADLAMMKKVLDSGDTKTITALSTPALCPGQGIMRRNVPGVLLGMQRFHWPEVTSDGMQALADLMDRVMPLPAIPEYSPSERRSEPQPPKTTVLLPQPNTEEIPPLLEPTEPAGVVCAVPKPLVGLVSAADYALICQAARWQDETLQKVVRTRIRDDLRERYGNYWDNDQWSSIKAVCDYHGWGLRAKKVWTPEMFEEMKRQSGYKCLACGRSEPEIKLEADHIIPKVKGGKDDPSNRQCLCHSCNASKREQVIDYRPSAVKKEA